MIAQHILRKIVPHMLVVFLVLWQHACASDDQQGETAEQVEGEQGEGNNEAANAPEGDNAAAAGAPAEAEIGNFNNLSNINDLANGVSDATAEVPPPAAVPAGTQDPVTGGVTPAPAAAAGAVQGGEINGRVVRFVTADNTPVYEAPQAGGSPVASMLQGDPVVVVLQGEWAQITDKRFVMASALSEAIVPRPKTPRGWNGTP